MLWQARVLYSAFDPPGHACSALYTKPCWVRSFPTNRHRAASILVVRFRTAARRRGGDDGEIPETHCAFAKES